MHVLLPKVFKCCRQRHAICDSSLHSPRITRSLAHFHLPSCGYAHARHSNQLVCGLATPSAHAVLAVGIGFVHATTEAEIES